MAVRSQSDLGSLADLGLRSVEADVRDRHAVRRAMRGVERVFHLAGTTNLRLNRAQTFALNLEGTRIVLEEALRAGVDRLIYTSSAAAVGPAPEGDTSDESSVWDAGRYDIPYVDSKHEAEIVALRLLARGLPVVIVNPAHVLGAGDPGRSSTVLVKRFMRREIPAYVDGTLNIVGVRRRRARAPARRRARTGRGALHPRQPQLHAGPAVRRPRPAVGRRAAGAEAAGAGRARARDRGRARAGPADADPGRDPCRLAELGICQQQGAP